MPISQIILARGSGSGGGGGGGGGTYLPWTVEWFHKSNPSQISSFPRVFGVATFPFQSIGFSIEGFTNYGWVGGSAYTAGTVEHNSWQHWAMVSDGSVLSIYKNGARVANSLRTSRVANSNDDFYVGIDSGASNGFRGLITNFRVVRNQAMYDVLQETITVPNQPLTGNANTELLLKATDSNSLITDSSSRNRNPIYGGIAWNADTPFSTLGPYAVNAFAVAINVIPHLYYFNDAANPNLANVQPGWTWTENDTGNTGTVTQSTVVGENRVISIQPATTLSSASGTFTQTAALGGSIETYTTQYGFMLYNAGIVWALDVPNP